MNVGERIRARRVELGWSQEELAFKMGYNGRSTIAKIESNVVEISHKKILQYAKILEVSVDYLLGTNDFEQTSIDFESNNEGDESIKTRKEDSRNVFSNNLCLLIVKSGKSRKEVSEAINVSYFTFSDWCNGKKYPRIENLEKLAKYFDITVPELLGEKKSEPKQIGKDEVLDIVLRLHTDKEFFQIVESLSALDSRRLAVLNQFLNVFRK